MNARTEEQTVDTQGMNYLVSLPRQVVTVYVPLAVFLFVLLFPFYWMGITTFKPNEELLTREGNPFWVVNPTLAHINKLLFETSYPEWLWNTMLVAVVSTFLSLVCSVLAAYAIERLRFRGAKHTGLAIFLAYLVPPSILFIPLADVVFKLGLYVGMVGYLLAVMLWQGAYRLPAALAVSFGTAVVFFIMFEWWLKVPLMQGPIEAWLGIH